MSVFESFMTGQRAGQQDYDRRQRQQIGGLMASGDYDAARQQAFGAGQFDLGTYAQGQGQALETRERQRTAGAMYGKSPEKAVDYARGQGDFELASQLDEMFANATEAEVAEATKRYGTLAGVAAPLREVPYQARRTMIMQQAPMLMQLGMTQEQIAAFDPTDANIDMVLSTAVGAEQYLTMQDRREREASAEQWRQRRYDQAERFGGQRIGISQGGLELRREALGGEDEWEYF